MVLNVGLNLENGRFIRDRLQKMKLFTFKI